MKKYTMSLFPLLCLFLLLLSACGSAAAGGRTGNGSPTPKGTSVTFHSGGGCWTRNGALASHADVGNNADPPEWEAGSSPFFGAQFISCQGLVRLSWSTGYDFYQVRWSISGSGEQQFSTHWQSGMDFSPAQFRQIYSFKVQGCNNGLFRPRCYDWSPTITVATYYPGECHPGYVWRGAFDSDRVCVTPATRDKTAYDNSQAPYRVDPNGAYGPDTCIQGFVWRGIVASDHVCVTPDTRDQVQYDNAHAAEFTYA